MSSSNTTTRPNGERRPGFTGFLPPEIENVYATKADAAELLHLSISRVSALILEGVLETSDRRFKRHALIKRSSIESYLDSFL